MVSGLKAWRESGWAPQQAISSSANWQDRRRLHPQMPLDKGIHSHLYSPRERLEALKFHIRLTVTWRNPFACFGELSQSWVLNSIPALSYVRDTWILHHVGCSPALHSRVLEIKLWFEDVKYCAPRSLFSQWRYLLLRLIVNTVLFMYFMWTFSHGSANYNRLHEGTWPFP